MDIYRVGMTTAAAAIRKLSSFKLLAVCYPRGALEKGTEKYSFFLFLKDICLALLSDMAKRMTGS